MRTRHAWFKCYKMAKSEVMLLKRKCRENEAVAKLLKDITKSDSDYLGNCIYQSLRYGLSYEDLQARDYVPVAKPDFYGYWRRTLFLLKEAILRSDSFEEIKKYLSDDFITLEEMFDKCDKAGLEQMEVIELAQNTGALVQFGQDMFRVDKEKIGLSL